MRRYVLLLVVLSLLTVACGGGGGSIADFDGSGRIEPPSTSTSLPDELALPEPTGNDAACQAVATWLLGVGFTGATAEPVDRLAVQSSLLEAPWGPRLAEATAGGVMNFAVASSLDLETIAQCHIPLTEAATMTALNGHSDCYLVDGQAVSAELCGSGRAPVTARVPELSDGAFCTTAQEFVRRDAGSLIGQAAIDELNAVVGSAPTDVERLLRDVVNDVVSDDVEDMWRDLFALDRLIAAGCGQSMAAEYLALTRSAVAGVPPPPPTTTIAPAPEKDPGSPLVVLCAAIEARFVGSAASEWAKVLAVGQSVSGPADVLATLSQLADSSIVGEAARGPLVAKLTPFLDGVCVETGLDQAGSGDGPGLPGSDEEEESDECDAGGLC